MSHDLLRLNYYELFEVEAAPFVAADLLVARYHQLVKCYHPDAVDVGTEILAYINKAYAVLKDPLQGVTYWLGLRSHQPVGGDLMLQFNLREQLENLQTRNALEQFLDHVEVILKTLPQRFLEALEQSLNHASAVVADWHFYEKLKTEVQQKRSTCLWYN